MPERRLAEWLRRAVDVRPGEARAALLAALYFFSLLCGYYILRPLRETMGVAAGVENLQWLFTATFAAMLLAVPLFGWLVARHARRVAVPWVYRFFILNLAAFYALLLAGVAPVWVARAFYVWVSLFNLFVVSVFWSVMADLFRAEQGRRLFGLVAAGGTAGALLGPGLTAWLAVPLGPTHLLPVSAAFLALSLACLRQLLRGPAPRHAAPEAEADAAPHAAVEADAPDAPGPGALGGSIWAGAVDAARSPYLLGVCGYLLLMTTTATFAYFEQAHIVAGAFDDPARRTRLFATIDLLVSALTLVVQVFLTGRLMGRLGVGVAVACLPLVTGLGFLALGASFGAGAALPVLVGFQAVRRASNYAVSRPARETLFTVVPRTQKYKAKNFIDTVVYRGGDALSGWAFAGLSAVGLGLAAIAWLAVPLAALWLLLGLALGRRQRVLEAAQGDTGPHPAPEPAGR